MGGAVTCQAGGLEGQLAHHYCAFYTECERELSPVTSGHRVALVYDLVRPPLRALLTQFWLLF